MRTAVPLILAVFALFSGCVEQPEEAPQQQPSELLVRVFLEDGHAFVRLAGIVDDTQVVPFDGDVELLLLPKSKCAWRPKVVETEVQEVEFTPAVLPYFEAMIPLPAAQPGEAVEIHAEAVLADGTLIRGAYATMF